MEYFEGPRVAARLSLGMRILNWAFTKPSASRRFRYCCDACAGMDQRQDALADHVSSVFVKMVSR